MTNACPIRRPGDLERIGENDVAELVAEIAAYLAAVAVFREEGCEPVWCSEGRPTRARVRVRTRR